jgi:hypothetical protein
VSPATTVLDGGHASASWQPMTQHALGWQIHFVPLQVHV